MNKKKTAFFNIKKKTTNYFYLDNIFDLIYFIKNKKE